MTLLQPVWNFILHHWGHVVSWWLFPSIVGLLAYVTVGIYFTLKDIGPLRSEATRIHKDVPLEAKEVFRIGSMITCTYAVLNAIAWFTSPHHITMPDQAPTIWEFARDFAISLLVGDFLVYVEHITHHKIRFLYRHVHCVHHSYKHDLFSWAASWVHPIEQLCFALCMVAYPWLLNPVHPLTLWAFEFVFIALVMEEHSGHDIWWSPHRWIPWWFGGAVPHDLHHLKVKTNYGFVLTIWDRMFGTYLPPAM